MTNTMTKRPPKSAPSGQAGKGKGKGKAKGKGGRKGAGKKGWRTAATSDRYELYELAVQDAESECDLVEQVWREQRGRLARSIREDFCGTAQVAAEWVKRREQNTATGVDLDPEVLGWSEKRMAERLDEPQRSRLSLVREDVRTVGGEPVDSVLAMNFSYYCFRTRDDLRRYFEHVRDSLVDDGLFLLDAYGGSEAFEEIEEERDLDGFTYVWDQHSYNPITGFALNYIHFRFPDGTEMTNAFEYEWRLWTLPEIQEVLKEAGFERVHVYWEGEDEDGEGNGEFTVATVGDACQGWIAYLVAVK